MAYTKAKAKQVTYKNDGVGSVVRDLHDKLGEFVSVKDFGAVGDGVTDDTAAIQAALSSEALRIIFPEGRYLIVKLVNNQTPALVSTVNNRVITGPGIITANAQVRRLLSITGDNTTIDGLQIDGNNCISYALSFNSSDPCVKNCYIHDLNGGINDGGVAINLNFEGRDSSAFIHGNRISNLQGVGNGMVDDGVGMQRAVSHSSDVSATKPLFITGNFFENCMGEEGDVVVITSGTHINPLSCPAFIQGNTFDGWSRRAVKIKANDVVVSGNYFTNDLSGDLSSLQRVVDIPAGNNITVSNNTFYKCKYQAQIGLYLHSPEVANNCAVINNVISGIGNTYSGGLLQFRIYGNTLSIIGNIIDCPDHVAHALLIQDTTNVIISSNRLNLGSSIWYVLENLSNIKTNGNLINNALSHPQSYYDVDLGEYVFNTTTGSNRISLWNSDPILNDGEIISSISCRQNDESNPAATFAAIHFIADGSIGSTAIGFATGSSGAPLVEKMRITAAGSVRPAIDGTQALGTTTHKWGRLFQSAVPVSTLGIATSGLRHFVSDSTVAASGNFGTIVSGGGTNTVPVYGDGTNWRIG